MLETCSREDIDGSEEELRLVKERARLINMSGVFNFETPSFPNIHHAYSKTIYSLRGGLSEL